MPSVAAAVMGSARAGLVEAEETGRERRGKPPGGTVGEIVWANGPALQDVVDEVPEEDVVAQPEAAEVQQPERQAEGHQPEGESPVGSIGECRALSILCLLQHALGQSLPAVSRKVREGALLRPRGPVPQPVGLRIRTSGFAIVRPVTYTRRG